MDYRAFPLTKKPYPKGLWRKMLKSAEKFSSIANAINCKFLHIFLTDNYTTLFRTIISRIAPFEKYQSRKLRTLALALPKTSTHNFSVDVYHPYSFRCWLPLLAVRTSTVGMVGSAQDISTRQSCRRKGFWLIVIVAFWAWSRIHCQFTHTITWRRHDSKKSIVTMSHRLQAW